MEILSDIKEDSSVWLCEGEKNAFALPGDSGRRE